MENVILVVSAKLRSPILRENTVQRHRLREALYRITSNRLTLVCAGAGYGKTTLLANVTSLADHVVWYSLSPTDQDLAVFVTYLIEGIRQHHPGFGSGVLRLLRGKLGTTPSPEAVAGHLVNALGEIGDMPLVLILDDYHFVDRNQAIRKLSDYLMMHLPSNVHLVISTRRPPRLPSLPRLRMLGEVKEILEEDLVFTSEEVQTLLEQVHGLHVGEEVVRAVLEQTEGWVIGLQLAGQALKAVCEKGGETPSTDLGPGKDRLFEYLAEEVFKRQPANVQRFLCETSVLSTLTTESCDAIFGRTDSAAVLDHIEQNNLFTVRVHDGCWRYHHLFRDFLRQQASKDSGVFKYLHCKAGAYFEDSENHVQAIQHYLAGADYPSAMRLIGRVGQAMFTSSRFDTLTFWIGQIPHRDIDRAPDLLLLQGQVLEAQGHYDRALVWLDRAMQAYVYTKDGIGLSRVLCAKAYVSLWRVGRMIEAEALCREALDLLGPENKAERADLLRWLASSQLGEGKRTDAEQIYDQALRTYEEVGDVEGTVATLINPGTWIYNWRGDFAEGLASLQRALNLAQQLDSKYWLAECLSNMSPLLRFLGRYQEAREHAERALELSREIGSVQLETWSLAYAGSAHDGRLVPDLKAGRRYLQEAARLAERTGNKRALIRALNSEVLNLRRTDEVAEAIKVANRALNIAEGSTDQFLIASARMHTGAALTCREPTHAEDLLLRARDDFLRYDDRFDVTRVNLWLAALYARSKPDEALECFQASLELAAAGGYDFWFLEEYRTAVPLLSLAISRNTHRQRCEHLLKEIGPVAIAQITALLDHEDPGIRRVAAEQIRQARELAGDPGFVGVSSPGDAADKNIVPTLSSAVPSEELAPLRIYCFGNFRVYVGDRLVQEREWQRRDVKSLLKYLAATPEHTVARDEVIELLWGNLEPEAARARLWKALYLLRQILQPRSKSSQSSYIESGQGLLTLRREITEMIDVDEFFRHLHSGRRAERIGDIDSASQEYEAAEMLCPGEFLSDDPYESWTMGKRERFRSLRVSILEKLARWRADRGDYEAAAEYAQKLLAEDPTREDVHAILMRCLARMGRRREALGQYVVCRRTLKEALHLNPASEIQQLYARLMAGEMV